MFERSTLPEEFSIAAGLISPTCQDHPVSFTYASHRGMIQGHHSGVMAAFRKEPHESVFGVAQSITRYAQEVSPEDRVALEQLAGGYVLRSAP